MMGNKILTLVLAGIVIVAGVGAAVVLMNDDNDTEGATVTDALGRNVVIPDRIDRLFCIGAGSLRIASYFGMMDKVKAIETASVPFSESDDQTYFVAYEAEVSALPRIATDAETIFQHNPDLVITASVDRTAVDNLSLRIGKPVFAIDSMLEFGEAFDGQMATLGKLFGREERAKALVDGINGFIREVTSKVTGESTATAYSCGMYHYGGAQFLKASGDYQPFQFSKIRNVQPPAANGQPYSITKETFLKYDPDYIFIDSVKLDDIVNEIRNDWDAYKNKKAIKEGNIYSCMVYKCYNTNWENQLINIFHVAQVMNGELYDWNLNDKADSILRLFFPGSDISYESLVNVQGGCGKVAITAP